MKITLAKFYFIIWVIYLAGLIYPDIERVIYFNELFALLGVLLSIDYFIKNNNRLGKVEFVYFIFICYGLIVFFLSLGAIEKAGGYLTLRTMPIYYNVFSFMLGYYIYINIIRRERLIFSKSTTYISLIISLITPWRLTPQVFAMFFIKNYKLLVLYFILFIFIKGGSTSFTALMFVGFLYFYKNNEVFRRVWSAKIIYGIIISFFILLYNLDDLYSEFMMIGYTGIFDHDINLTWRLMFWIYLLKEQVMVNPLFGIGFGAPLFELGLAPSFITSDDGSRLTEYTLGTHNSLVFLLTRMGVVGLTIVIYLHALVYKRAFALLTNKGRGIGEVESLVLCNLMFVNSALFNVVLETPLYGGMYWITFGLLYASTKFSSEKKYD